MKPLLPFLLLAILTGCGTGSGSPGKTIARYQPNTPPTLNPAPADGQYALFQAGQSAPVALFPLRRNEPLGFKTTTGGTVEGTKLDPELWGIAGQNMFQIAYNSKYVWNRVDTQ